MGKIPVLTNILQMGRNHQLVFVTGRSSEWPLRSHRYTPCFLLGTPGYSIYEHWIVTSNVFRSDIDCKVETWDALFLWGMFSHSKKAKTWRWWSKIASNLCDSEPNNISPCLNFWISHTPRVFCCTLYQQNQQHRPIQTHEDQRVLENPSHLEGTPFLLGLRCMGMVVVILFSQPSNFEGGGK